jgi:hypothetical protein
MADTRAWYNDTTTYFRITQNSYPQVIDDYMRDKTNETVTLHDLQCFVGMLQTHECTLEHFTMAGVELEQIARRFGSANCWTGTSRTLAANLLRWIQKCK